MSSLPTSDIVEDVFLGDDGLLAAVDDGTMVVEMSTVAPESVEAMAEAVEGRDVSVVDSPVIGTPPVAERSELTIPIGCSEAAFERVEPVVDHLGDRIDHVGRVGNGKRVKLANNVMTFGNWALAAEMHALVGRLGLDVEQFYDITSSGIAHADIVDEKAAKAFEGDYEPGFTIDGARGDLRYAIGMKEAADFPAPIAAAVAEQYDAGAALAGGDRDYSSMLEAFRTLGED
jgi:3-hydroxyisobutyrate dehydrogenase-like beta-hydroxyacid dehydrogenase